MLIEVLGLFQGEVKIFFQVLQFFSRFLPPNPLFFQVFQVFQVWTYFSRFSRFSRCGGNPGGGGGPDHSEPYDPHQFISDWLRTNGPFQNWNCTKTRIQCTPSYQAQP